ncbi:2-amino-4-hydroxy-6-hydroxymethyldihydropteridine diphosphokinase [Thalassotalea agarivorans]|uniref:2-amino-4-hydroxy-6-hydroxymethyldihydropteridine diphosphokinase n=1 Tax=Thalassotalea agarivorans TaxID=349064 RepID=A0A1I0AS67_THASX|nr:2-amino-4-hydroxy-6-hydroxymethyldihydropteridine diphosphokinase [Thalassotalea agarivorans]SES97205.1 2-amino-4-hydroxy-6-hydroxymethyldihydropteridinediphosphokinase [Thalassotalea agarivorans]
MAIIYISLGTNIDRDHYLEQGLLGLEQAFGQLTLSSLFESASVGFNGSDFYNMVIAAETELPIAQVVTTLKDIERANGRKPSAKKFSSRTLDLDLLLYDDVVTEQPIQLPRAEITENAFVLWPLQELAGALLHPELNISYDELWRNYDKSSQQLRIVPFNWQR